LVNAQNYTENVVLGAVVENVILSEA